MRRRCFFATLLIVAGAAVAVPSGAGAAVKQCLLTEATRIHTFKLNLDGDRAKERIDIYNFDAAATPVTLFQTCDPQGAIDRLVQRTTVTVSPGNRESGLRDAWVGDLNRDTRVEVAARDAISASAGEVLSLYRQTTRHGLRFGLLQRVTGDVVTLTRHPGASATITARLKANHARDNKAHTEHWSYSRTRGKWRCTRDCGGR